jgi:hypothetical protein
MLRRLLVGLLIGLVIGGLMAFALMRGLGTTTFDGSGDVVFAYLFAAITGVVTGLVAGKPIWASGGQIEAGLKAVFGALLAAAGMFALRQWVHVPLNLTSLGDASLHGDIGSLPAAALPLLGALIGGFYELDNTPATDKEKDAAKKAKTAAPGAKASRGANGKARIAAEMAEDDDEIDAPSKKAQR